MLVPLNEETFSQHFEVMFFTKLGSSWVIDRVEYAFDLSQLWIQ